MTVVELMETVLPGNDRRVVKLAQSKLEEMGVEFHLGDAVESVVRSEHGRMLSTLRSGAVIESEIVMSAVGRVPNSADLGFSEVGLSFDRRALKVDEYYRTNVPGIYAIGDLIGGMMLAHVAEEEGVLAARNAVAELRAAADGSTPALESMRYDCIPACVYTFPEVAVVGSSRDSAKEARHRRGTGGRQVRRQRQGAWRRGGRRFRPTRRREGHRAHRRMPDSRSARGRDHP